ncbi:MAG: FAD-binding protein [Limimaricola sp.]|uniref:FAD-binding protein n=1 Tax=Limimaricola sp. TaxID=2211665 RepID=UPI001DDA9367|nr:FAD-binding protein [Limimaricola sp.]MBI1417623.1 FAD-binding protein [Limimaricola sp.]
MRPRTEQELAEVVRDARGPLRIAGGGTRPIGRPVTGEVLETAGLSGITLYEPGALTLVAQAGTLLEDVEAALAFEGQRLPFEPMDHRALLGTKGRPTIGAVAAMNNSGPRRIAVGAARDFMLGVRFVDGAGNIIKNGGRVMKNVTGYDLVRLMAGAHGSLGVLTEVAFKVLPAVEQTATVILRDLEIDRAVAAMAAAMGSPFEVTGAAHDPETGETALRLEGFATSVAYRAGRLAEALAAFGASEIEVDKTRVAARWTAIRDVTAFAKRQGDVWRLSVTPSDAPAIAARLQASALRFDWAGGLIWALVPEGTDLRGRLGAFPGHATLIRASTETRSALASFQPEAPAVAALSAGLRARFDPRGILNPGIML